MKRKLDDCTREALDTMLGAILLLLGAALVLGAYGLLRRVWEWA